VLALHVLSDFVPRYPRRIINVPTSCPPSPAPALSAAFDRGVKLIGATAYVTDVLDGPIIERTWRAYRIDQIETGAKGRDVERWCCHARCAAT
jgi:formyltetrahydrofolate hydrolase